MIENREILTETTPFYFIRTAFSWRLYIKCKVNNTTVKNMDRIDKACITLFPKLEQSDKELLMFFGGRSETSDYVLSGYARETGTQKQEVRIRFHWLCWRLAVKSGLINPFYWIEPPQHYIEIELKKGKINYEQQD